MSERTETEIKSITKEQNYMCGYRDGKSDVLDKIRAEIVELTKCPYGTECLGAGCPSNTDCMLCGDHVLEIIDKYKAESEGI
jgi:hypothetical protein